MVRMPKVDPGLLCAKIQDTPWGSDISISLLCFDWNTIS